MFTDSCFFVGGLQPSACVCVNAERYVSTDSLIFVDFSFAVGLILILSVSGRLFEVVFVFFLGDGCVILFG